MTAEQSRDIAVTILAHAKMAPDPKTKIENCAHEIRYIAQSHLWHGVAVGIGGTLIVGIIVMLLLGFCNHMHLPMG